MIDPTVLKKKLSTYRSPKGQIRNLPDEVLGELLRSWESWTGPSKDFYSSLGFSRRQMASVIGKAKKLKREGHFPAEDFQEIQLTGNATGSASGGGPGCGGSGIELSWSEGKVIRFCQVEQLVEFLKKAA
jgi:hypothetical protein